MITCFSIASGKKAATEWVEEKGRKTAETRVVARPGGGSPQAQWWYDDVPKKGSKISSFNKAWTFAGDQKSVMCPMLVGEHTSQSGVALYGYIIRVSNSVAEWDEKKSAFIYMDVFKPKLGTVCTVRLSVEQFNADFDHRADPDIGHFENETKKTLNNTLKKCAVSKYEGFIKQFDNVLTQYYMLSDVVEISQINSSCDFK